MRSSLHRLFFYWPQAGIGLGVFLNMLGLTTKHSELIATGANVLTVCGLFLVQRRRNDRRDGESE